VLSILRREEGPIGEDKLYHSLENKTIASQMAVVLASCLMVVGGSVAASVSSGNNDG
jgi:hypothetical protein